MGILSSCHDDPIVHENIEVKSDKFGVKRYLMRMWMIKDPELGNFLRKFFPGKFLCRKFFIAGKFFQNNF